MSNWDAPTVRLDPEDQDALLTIDALFRLIVADLPEFSTERLRVLSVRRALFDLVQVATFAAPRFQTDFTWKVEEGPWTPGAE